MSAACDVTRPHTRSLTATLGRDSEVPLTVPAPIAGRVAAVFPRAGARVDRDEPVLRLADPAGVQAGTLVTAPAAGLVVELAPTGSTVAPGTPLFRLLANAVVDVILHADHGPIDRDSIADCTVRCGVTTLEATVRRIETQPGGVRVCLAVADPDGRLPLGASVAVELSITPTEAMVEAALAARRAAYARCYTLPPRGIALKQLNPVATKSQPPSAAKTGAAGPYDPTRLFAPRRPKREPAPFRPIAVGPLSAAPQRPTLALSPDAWRGLRPATYVAARGRVSDHVDVGVRVEHSLANPQALAVTAPVAGVCRPAPGLCAGEPVTPGQPLFILDLTADVLSAQRVCLQAHEAGDDNAVARCCALLADLGLDAAHRHTLRRRREPFSQVAVVAPLAGMIAEVGLPAGGAVSAGTTLLTLTPANTTFAVFELDAAAFARLPPRVGARWVGTSTAHPAVELPLLEQAFVNRDGRDCFRLRLPLTAAHAASVRGTPVTPLLRLDDPATRRDAVVVPVDCVVSVAASTEVLLHTGAGHLRAASVACGLRADGFVEILDGVQVGEPLVRDVALLQSEEKQLRALLAGFWNPSPRFRPDIPRQGGNPLL